MCKSLKTCSPPASISFKSRLLQKPESIWLTTRDHCQSLLSKLSPSTSAVDLSHKLSLNLSSLYSVPLLHSLLQRSSNRSANQLLAKLIPSLLILLPSKLQLPRVNNQSHWQLLQPKMLLSHHLPSSMILSLLHLLVNSPKWISVLPKSKRPPQTLSMISSQILQPHHNQHLRLMPTVFSTLLKWTPTNKHQLMVVSKVSCSDSNEWSTV